MDKQFAAIHRGRGYLQSLKSNRYGILLMLIAAVAVASGQLFWKLSQGWMGWHLFLGFLLYGLGALLMIAALHFGKLSVVHPLLCLSYVAGLILSHYVLFENLCLSQYAGIACIVVGVFMISIGDR